MKLWRLYSSFSEAYQNYYTKNEVSNPTTLSPELKCKDYHTSCKNFAVNDGCVQHAKFMSSYCPKTCGTCRPKSQGIFK